MSLNARLAQDDHVEENYYRKVAGQKFTYGEKVLCCNILSPLLIEAKCQGVKVVRNIYHYLIHYSGWNKSCK